MGGIFGGEIFGRNFWEEFLGGNFWEEFWEEFLGGVLWRNSLFTLELTCLSRIWFLSRFCLNGEGRTRHFDP